MRSAASRHGQPLSVAGWRHGGARPAADGPEVDGPEVDGPEVDGPEVAPPGAPLPADPRPTAEVVRRAHRLLLCYPPGWRARYGEEFAELLIADLSEQPRAWRRTADVIRGGLTARLAGAGLAGYPLDPAAAARAGLATSACALGTFLVFGTAIWAQLTIGWQWAPPASPATSLAVVVMSAAMAIFAALAALAAPPVIWAAVRAARAGAGRALRRPALLLTLSAAVLALGGHHFQNGWPGTGGYPWHGQHLVPGGVAAFAWACTLPVTSYWAHPAALAAFPAPELAWMALSPAAMLCLVAGVAGVVRRVALTSRVLAYERWLGRAAGTAMAAFLGATACWLTEGGPGPRGLFHAGVIDAVGAAIMLAALAVGWRALRWVAGGVRPTAGA